VYISLETVYAQNSCGYVGGQHVGSLVTLATNQVYSVDRYQTDCVDAGYSYNFANLLPGLPQSAWSAAIPQRENCVPANMTGLPVWQNGDNINGMPLGPGEPCANTIADQLYCKSSSSHDTLAQLLSRPWYISSPIATVLCGRTR
jgi:hypothetical protein